MKTKTPKSAETLDVVYNYNGDGRFVSKNRAGNNITDNYTNADNKIESVTVNGSNYSFAYDTKGNVTNDGLNNALPGNYSFRNLPTTMNNFNYTYNDGGERIKKLETDSARTDYYLRDYLGRELVIYNYETNDPKQVNIFGNGLVGKIEIDTTETRSYYLKDHLGNIRTIVDANGTVVSAMDYYPYGETIRQFNNTRYMLTEKERDTESSNDYFGARYYNNKLGVWLQVDPLSERYAGWSPYNYTLCNPMNLIDLKGMEAEDNEEQRKKDELYEWLSSGHEGFPGENGNNNKQATVPGNERNKIDQPTALEIINQLGKEFQDAFKKSGLSATEFLAEASGKYSSITNDAGVVAILTPGLEEYAPFALIASKYSGTINLLSMIVNKSLGGKTYSTNDIYAQGAKLFTVPLLKISGASKMSQQVVDFFLDLFGVAEDIESVIK